MGQVETRLQDSMPPMFEPQAFSQIVSNAPIAISITDDNGTILYVNQMFSDITGYCPEELIGRNSSLLSYKATPKQVYENLWHTINSGQHWQGQLVNRKKNGEPYIAEISISRFRDTQGQHCFYAIHKDITEKHQLLTDLKNQSVMFEAVLNNFRDERETLLALANEPEIMGKRTAKRAVSYLEDFYKIIDNPKKLNREILEACR